MEKLSADELLGFFDLKEEKGDFVLDLEQAREDRAIDIINKNIKVLLSKSE